MKSKQKNNNKQGSFLPNFLIRPITNVQTNGKQSRDNVSRDLQGGDPSAMAPVVQAIDCAIQRINHYPVVSIRENNYVIHWIEIYPVGKLG